MVTNEQIEELASTLEGSCDSLTSGCNRLGIDEHEITQEQWIMFDDLVYQCPCGWWIEDSEMQTDEYGIRICDDCYDALEEEND